MRKGLEARAQIELKDGVFSAVFTGGSALSPEPLSSLELTVLECFLWTRSPAAVVAKLSRRRRAESSEQQKRIKALIDPSKRWLFRFMHRALKAYADGARVNLTNESRAQGDVFRILARLVTKRSRERGTRQSIEKAIAGLEAKGLLVPPVGGIDFGDLRRARPICSMFGMSRGTVVDRYYLECFLDQIRYQVRGRTVEIGGQLANREKYRFENVTEYVAADLYPGPGVTQLGNAHDPSMFAPEQFDSIVCFNVLEHMREPWVAVDNFYRWLKPGGSAFVMVPLVQRIHGSPKDYWRLLPDAFEALFERFENRKFFHYGNPLSAVAALMGIAAEELRSKELDARHPDYPVISCATVTRAL